jgi:hypothetical protein
MDEINERMKDFANMEALLIIPEQVSLAPLAPSVL